MPFGKRGSRCCCGSGFTCPDCNNELTLDITSANLYTTSTYLNAQVVGTFVLTNGDDVRDIFPPNQCTDGDKCYSYDRLNDYTISGGSFPANDCTADKSVSGVRYSEWTVDLCSDGEIMLFHRFTAAVWNGLFWTRDTQLLEFTIDSVDVNDDDLTNGTGVDLSNSYVSNYYSWSGAAWVSPYYTFSCSTASLNEPYDGLAGTIKLSTDMTTSGCTWYAYNLAGTSAMTNWLFTGMDDTNSDCSTLWGTASGSYPSLTFDFYSDSARTSKVATGTLPTLPGTMTISQQNSSGLSGSVDVASSPTLSPSNFELVCQSV
jgi:hypothetical protein